VASLVVAVNVTDRAQRRGDGPIDARDEAGGVQDYDGLTCAAPVLAVEPDTVQVQKEFSRFV